MAGQAEDAGKFKSAYINSTGPQYRVKGLNIPVDQALPKADEQLAHLRYLPRMGKDSLLCALRVSVVR